VRGEREEGGRWTGGFNWVGRERAAAGRKKRKNVGRGEGRWAGLDRFSFKTSQNFSQLFLRLFTSILRLLKPHHNQNSCIST
jgi:hypothetical protein